MCLLLLYILFTDFDFLAITDMVNVTNISQHDVSSAHKLYMIISYFALNWEIYHAKILTFIIEVGIMEETCSSRSLQD